MEVDGAVLVAGLLEVHHRGVPRVPGDGAGGGVDRAAVQPARRAVADHLRLDVGGEVPVGQHAVRSAALLDGVDLGRIECAIVDAGVVDLAVVVSRRLPFVAASGPVGRDQQRQRVRRKSAHRGGPLQCGLRRVAGKPGLRALYEYHPPGVGVVAHRHEVPERGHAMRPWPGRAGNRRAPCAQRRPRRSASRRRRPRPPRRSASRPSSSMNTP